MKLQHVQRFNRENMDDFSFMIPFLLILSSFCTNMTTWCLYNTFKCQMLHSFIHPSTQPTKIWSYSISRDLIGEILILLYFWPTFYLFSARFAAIWQHGAYKTLLNAKFFIYLSTHLPSLPKYEVAAYPEI